MLKRKSWFVCLVFAILRNVARFVTYVLWDDEDLRVAKVRLLHTPGWGGGSVDVQSTNICCVLGTGFRCPDQAVFWLPVMGSGSNFVSICKGGWGGWVNRLYTPIMPT